MEATFEVLEGDEFPLVRFTYTEPSQKRNGDPIDDLAFVYLYYGIDGAITQSIKVEALSKTGGQKNTTSNYVAVAVGEKKNVEFWGIAENLGGHPSDESEHKTIVIDRAPFDPQLSPMPPQ